nr:hypothetical protein [Tanacetum cinerariifolium]
DLGHSGDIIYIIDVSVDYLHQLCRAFATIINKCLSGKETGMNKIYLSRAQILWDVSTPIIGKNVIESLEAAVMTRSSSQPQSSYEAAATLSKYELTKILIDK